MIDYFNDVPVRQSGVVFSSIFDQIKKMHAVDPEMAGELAISAIELVLTDQISSDDPMIDMMSTPAKVINDNNVQRYELKKENSRIKKIKDMKLQEIADMFFHRGIKQKEIAERFNLSQQTVSYRINLIRTSYPELMQDEGDKTAKMDVYQKTNGTKSGNFVSLVNLQNGTPAPTKESVCEESVQTISSESESLPKNLQTNPDVYQNTKDTKKQNFVNLSDAEMFVKNPSQSGKSFFDF